jgi:hypothetical protein
MTCGQGWRSMTQSSRRRWSGQVGATGVCLEGMLAASACCFSAALAGSAWQPRVFPQRDKINGQSIREAMSCTAHARCRRVRQHQ